jgi:hypothetical protein
VCPNTCMKNTSQEVVSAGGVRTSLENMYSRKVASTDLSGHLEE